MWSNRNSWSFQFILEPFGFCPFSILRIAFAARESYGHFVSSETSNQCSLNERLKSATGDAIFSYMPFIPLRDSFPFQKISSLLHSDVLFFNELLLIQISTFLTESIMESHDHWLPFYEAS